MKYVRGPETGDLLYFHGRPETLSSLHHLFCYCTGAHCSMYSKPNTGAGFVVEKKGFIAGCQARRWEKISQICLPKGWKLGVFKDKGSGCDRVCRLIGIC